MCFKTKFLVWILIIQVCFDIFCVGKPFHNNNNINETKQEHHHLQKRYIAPLVNSVGLYGNILSRLLPISTSVSEIFDEKIQPQRANDENYEVKKVHIEEESLAKLITPSMG